MKTQTKPTEKELEILQILWAQGPSTVRDVNDILVKDREVGYTTTLKFMQILHDKGLVARTKEGKTHRYEALISEAETQESMVNELVQTAFRGSAMKLVMGALGAHTSSKKELAEIRKYLDKLEGGEQ